MTCRCAIGGIRLFLVSDGTLKAIVLEIDLHEIIPERLLCLYDIWTRQKRHLHHFRPILYLITAHHSCSIERQFGVSQRQSQHVPVVPNKTRVHEEHLRQRHVTPQLNVSLYASYF